MGLSFIHISDLHFGKLLHRQSMLEDQRIWAERFLDKVKELRPQAVLISGDVYDRGVPSAEAVTLLDDFLTGLSELGPEILLVAGNHDSGERLNFGSRMFKRSRLHIAGKAPGCVVTLNDSFGPVDFLLMPYIYPQAAAFALNDESIHDYTTAMKLLIEHADLKADRRVILAHQTVTANGELIQDGSETATIGGVDAMDYSVFDRFDYAALGHIHAPQKIGREEVRYCGSPLAYHFEEKAQSARGPLLVTMGAPGEKPKVERIEIEPWHTLQTVRGTYAEVTEKINEPYEDRYVAVILTDIRKTPEIIDAVTNAIERHKNSRCLKIDSEYALRAAAVSESSALKQHSVASRFAEFYRSATMCDPDEADDALLAELERLITDEDFGVGEIPSEKAVDSILKFIRKQ